MEKPSRKERKVEKLSEECRLRGEGGSAHSENFSLLPDVHQLSVAAFPCPHICCSVVSEEEEEEEGELCESGLMEFLARLKLCWSKLLTICPNELILVLCCSRSLLPVWTVHVEGCLYVTGRLVISKLACPHSSVNTSDVVLMKDLQNLAGCGGVVPRLLGPHHTIHHCPAVV